MRFTGKAVIEEARLDIDDLLVMPGDTGRPVCAGPSPAALNRRVNHIISF